MYFKGNRIISSSLILGTFSTIHLACSNGQVFAQKCENETNSKSSINHTQLKDQTKESRASYIWWILAAIISVGGMGLIFYFLTYLFKTYSEAECKRVVEKKLSELEVAYTEANNLLQNENVEVSCNRVSELYESICLCEKVLKEYTSEVEAASLLKGLYSSLFKTCNIDCKKVRATLKDVSEAFCNRNAGTAMKILDKKRQNHIDFNVNNKEENVENGSFADFFDENEEPLFHFELSEIKKLRSIEATLVEVNVKSFLKILDRDSVKKFLGTNKSFADNDTVTLSFIDVGAQGCIAVKCTFKNSEDLGYFETKCLKKDRVDNFLNFLQNKQKAPDKDFKVLSYGCGAPPIDIYDTIVMASSLLVSLRDAKK